MSELEDLRKRSAAIINTEWKYSWHWGKYPEKRHWTMDAKHDCIERIQETEKELRNLKALYDELNEIAPLYIPY